MLNRFSKWLTLTVVLLLTGLTVQSQAAEPEQIVRAFLDAWNTKQTETMYGYLSSLSKEEYPLDVFKNRYDAAHGVINLTGLTYTIQDVKLQGASAAVTYDVTIQSSSFGEIVDPGRTMRLVQIDGQWGIAWSSMDIFDALAGASTLYSDGELPPRANIYDRNGNPVAYQGTMVITYTSESYMPNVTDCQNLLVDITRKPLSFFVAQFLNYDDVTIFPLIEVDQDTYNIYREQLAMICGVDTTRTYETRLYYGGNAMSHVVGYVGRMQENQIAQYVAQGYARDVLIGQSHIEQQYQRQLAGSPQRVLRISEPGGMVLRTLGGSEGTAPTPVTLTIDRDLQVATVDALSDAFAYAGNNWGAFAEGGAAVVIDVNTGEILALASYPLVDPMIFNPDTGMDLATFAEAQKLVANDRRRPLFNHAVQEQYAPGSVYKVITAVAVLNEDIVEPDTIFECGLTWDGRRYGDQTAERSDWRKTDGLEAAGPITPAQAIMASCNPFFWEFGAIMYRDKGKKLIEYSRMMGLGTKYNLFGGTVLEAEGELDNPVNPPEAINNAIGQGDVALPPLQMVVATAAIANDGKVYKPYIVQKVGDADGTELVQAFTPQVLQELDLKPDVLPTVREGMCGAVTDYDYGTAWRVFNDQDTRINYTACGKTGTAQAGERSNAWFITFAPAESPQIAIVVAVPRAGREGSEVAAPIARRILDYYFNSPVASYPSWWNTEPFIPLPIPEGGGGN